MGVVFGSWGLAAFCWAAFSAALSRRIFWRKRSRILLVVAQAVTLTLVASLARLLRPHVGDLVGESPWTALGALAALLLIAGWFVPVKREEGPWLSRSVGPVLICLGGLPLLLLVAASAGEVPDRWYDLTVVAASTIAASVALFWAGRLDEGSFLEMESAAGKHLLNAGLVLLGISAATAGYGGGSEVVFEPIRIPSPGTALLVLGLALLAAFLGFIHGRRRGLVG